MLFIGQNQKGEQQVCTMNLRHLEAIYHLIRQSIQTQLEKNSDWITQNDITLDAFDMVSLDELPAPAFNLAYRLIMESKNEWIEPLIPKLKPMFEADPRFAN